MHLMGSFKDVEGSPDIHFLRACSLLVLLNGSEPFWRKRTDQDGVNEVEEIKSGYHPYSSSSFSFVIQNEKVWFEDLFALRSVCGQEVQDYSTDRKISTH